MLWECECANAMAKSDEGNQHDDGGCYTTGYVSSDGTDPGNKRQTVRDDDEHTDDVPMLWAEILDLPEQQCSDSGTNQHGTLQRRLLKQTWLMMTEAHEYCDC